MTHAAVLSELQGDWIEHFDPALSIERRSKLRFPLDLGTHYQTVGKGQPCIGTGLVGNMSSSGLFVAGEHEVDAGRRIKLTVEWPTLLNGEIPLQLVIDGKVVRSEASGFGVELHRHQFRTCKRALQLIAVPAIPFHGITVSRTPAHGSRVKELPPPATSHPGIGAVQFRRRTE
jgi:hypothetical protein